MKVYLVMVTNEDWGETFSVYEVCETLEKAKEIANKIKIKYDYDDYEVHILPWKAIK